MKKFLIKIIRGYQNNISRNTRSSCRFYPTCSNYAIEAIQLHGAFKGTVLAVYRILRCNPLGGKGYDPVPPKKMKGK